MTVFAREADGEPAAGRQGTGVARAFSQAADLAPVPVSLPSPPFMCATVRPVLQEMLVLVSRNMH
jgi:hypothetical protein